MAETAIQKKSVLTCPKCGMSKEETMPTDACQYFYDCTGCGAVLRPLPGDCCVYCSYGTVVCPPRQTAPDACGCNKSPPASESI